ncbi:hypothetical protein [Chitinophaga sp. CF418]|uniref:hypothetical protein n=1 Tax=Chitinophaga sp. CF418 TaxID=1855287 RepID=UPI0009236BBD|nr:hypothetical protein [Chitinophaga sp. CF418]SHN29539.1 hypothetical protein SAMN05216311_108216 [Chitinophaga sp. CF418]
MFEVIFNSKKEEQHYDISVNISDIGFSSEVDSYYLCIDPFFMPDQEGPDKVEKCLKLMIASWMATIEQMEVNQIVYLPYDFSDQYIGALKVQKMSLNEISLGSGCTTKYSGFQKYPSKDTFLDLDDEEFDSDGNDTILLKNGLISQLNDALKVL